MRRRRCLLDSSDEEFDDAVPIDYTSDSVVMRDFPGVKNFPNAQRTYLSKETFPKPATGETYEELIHKLAEFKSIEQEEEESFWCEKSEVQTSFSLTLMDNLRILEQTKRSYNAKVQALNLLIHQKNQNIENLHCDYDKILIKMKETKFTHKEQTIAHKTQLYELKKKSKLFNSEIEGLKNELKCLEEESNHAQKRLKEILTKISEQEEKFELTIGERRLDYGNLFLSLIDIIDEAQNLNIALIQENNQLKQDLHNYALESNDLRSQIENLEKEVMILNVRHEVAKKTIHQRNMVIAKMKKQYQVEKVKVARILRNRKISNKNILDQIEKQSSEELPAQFNHELLADLVKNDKVSPYARKYTEKTVEIAYVLHAYSPLAYELLRKLIPLPSEEVLRIRFSDTINRKTMNLLNLDQLKYLLDEIRKSYELVSITKQEVTEDNEHSIDEDHINTNCIPAALAFDAASADPKKTNSGALFLYQLQPLKQNYAPHPVHIIPQSNGKGKQKHIDTAIQISQISEKYNIINKYLCTDSDSATNIIHNEFNKYMLSCPYQSFDEIIKYVDLYKNLIPVSDLLHILKNLRSRMIAHIIYISEAIGDLDFIKLCNDRNIDEDMYQSSRVFAMRDDLALKIFHTDNLKDLYDNEYWNEFIFILPYVILINVIQSNTLTMKARLKLLELSYGLITMIAEKSQNKYPEKPRLKKGKPQKACYITSNQLIRTKNDILALAHAITFYPNSLAFSRLGTHLVEFKFGEMRRISYGNNSSNALTNAIVKSEVVKDILQKNSLTQKYRGRVDFGGSRENGKWDVNLPFDQIKSLLDEIQIILEEEQNQSNMKELDILVNFLYNESPSPEVKLQGDLSGTQINARNIAYKNKVNDD